MEGECVCGIDDIYIYIYIYMCVHFIETKSGTLM